MKNLNVEINSEKIENCALKINEVGKNIEQIFKQIDTIMEEIHNENNWQGDTCDAYYNRYLELKEYFPKVNNGINNISEFLYTTSNNYKDAEKTINASVDSNLNNLNVNS